MSKLQLETQNFTGDQNNIYNVESYSPEVWCYADFYVIGQLWVDALRAALVGIELIPSVHAAANETQKPPMKPPPMKATELPLYDTPHAEYKECLLEKAKCPKCNVKIAQEYLYPKVKSLRKDLVAAYTEYKREVIARKNELSDLAHQKAGEAVDFMRDPAQLHIRLGVVALGTISGLCLGGRLLTKRLFFASLGALATGALCFPRETDEVFRDVSYRFGKLATELISITSGQNFRMRDSIVIPCARDLPDGLEEEN